MVVSRDINLIITPDAAPKNACGRGTGNKYIISHGLIPYSGKVSREETRKFRLFAKVFSTKFGGGASLAGQANNPHKFSP